MAQTPLFGVQASVTLPSGIGCLFNAFSYGLTQSYAEAIGFGYQDAQGYGAIRRASGVLSGVTTNGTANNVPGHAAIIQAPASLTLTFLTGCTLVFNMVFTALNMGVALENADQSSYGYTRSGSTTETWVTS